MTEASPVEASSEPVLTPVLSSRFALRLIHAPVTLFFGVLLMVFSYLPLRHTELWGHLIYGRAIVAEQALPKSDPTMPLLEGMPVIDAAWLSQVALEQVEHYFGAEGLSQCFTLVVWFALLFLGRAMFLQSRSVGAMLLAALVAVAVGWSRTAIIRPEIFSVLCFSVLAWLMCRNLSHNDDAANDDFSAHGPERWLWYSVVPLFALWANVHITFVVGLVLLLTTALGRGCDVLRTTGSPWRVLADPAFRGWVLATELALAATLVNPYGIELWFEWLRLVRSPILRDLPDWGSLVLLNVGGREFALGFITLLFVWRWSRRGIRARELFWLAVTGYITLVHVRLISWFAPALAMVLAPHVGELFARRFPRPAADSNASAEDLPSDQSFRYSLLCATLAWICFSFTPMAAPILGHAPRPVDELYGDVPLKLTEGDEGYLVKHKPTGLVYCPAWWGDWLAWRIDGLQVFAGTQLERMPRQVWLDYRRISDATGGWEAALDRYKVNTLIIDKESQTALVNAIQRTSGWAIKYDDNRALVVVRSAPAPSAQPVVAQPPQPVAAVSPMNETPAP